MDAGRAGVAGSRPALVVHASRHGSTREVAEVVAATLDASGLPAEVAPAGEARAPLTGRPLVVVGGALYNGRWHRDARRFLKRHRDELSVVPVAVFATGPRETSEAAWDHSRAQLDRALAARSWVTPVSVGLFGGVDPPRRGRERRPRRDARDWAVIRAWATEVARRAAQEQPPG